LKTAQVDRANRLPEQLIFMTRFLTYCISSLSHESVHQVLSLIYSNNVCAFVKQNQLAIKRFGTILLLLHPCILNFKLFVGIISVLRS